MDLFRRQVSNEQSVQDLLRNRHKQNKDANQNQHDSQRDAFVEDEDDDDETPVGS